MAQRLPGAPGYIRVTVDEPEVFKETRAAQGPDDDRPSGESANANLETRGKPFESVE
ncbi:MAG: hypothetical protein H0W55_10245 [Actinobacteria bacterium]|nr:hypothetical protein [Actinomycetota bacterium]